MKILERYPDHWMRHLREGHRVYLVKEDCFGFIGQSYTPPEYSGGYAGTIFVSKNSQFYEKWYVREDGNGLDGQPLMRPVEGNLADTHATLFSGEAYKIHKRIDELEKALGQMIKLSGLIPTALGESKMDTVNKIKSHLKKAREYRANN